MNVHLIDGNFDRAGHATRVDDVGNISEVVRRVLVVVTALNLCLSFFFRIFIDFAAFIVLFCPVVINHLQVVPVCVCLECEDAD